MTHQQILNSKSVEQLAAECLRLRQALWDIAGIAGADLDGDKTPDALVNDIVEFATDAVRDLRECYQSVQSEHEYCQYDAESI